MAQSQSSAASAWAPSPLPGRGSPSATSSSSSSTPPHVLGIFAAFTTLFACQLFRGVYIPMVWWCLRESLLSDRSPPAPGSIPEPPIHANDTHEAASASGMSSTVAGVAVILYMLLPAVLTYWLPATLIRRFYKDAVGGGALLKNAGNVLIVLKLVEQTSTNAMTDLHVALAGSVLAFAILAVALSLAANEGPSHVLHHGIGIFIGIIADVWIRSAFYSLDLSHVSRFLGTAMVVVLCAVYFYVCKSVDEYRVMRLTERRVVVPTALATPHQRHPSSHIQQPLLHPHQQQHPYHQSGDASSRAHQQQQQQQQQQLQQQQQQQQEHQQQQPHQHSRLHYAPVVSHGLPVRPGAIAIMPTPQTYNAAMYDPVGSASGRSSAVGFPSGEHVGRTDDSSPSSGTDSSSSSLPMAGSTITAATSARLLASGDAANDDNGAAGNAIASAIAANSTGVTSSGAPWIGAALGSFLFISSSCTMSQGWIATTTGLGNRATMSILVLQAAAGLALSITFLRRMSFRRVESVAWARASVLVPLAAAVFTWLLSLMAFEALPRTVSFFEGTLDELTPEVLLYAPVLERLVLRQIPGGEELATTGSSSSVPLLSEAPTTGSSSAAVILLLLAAQAAISCLFLMPFAFGKNFFVPSVKIPLHLATGDVSLTSATPTVRQPSQRGGRQYMSPSLASSASSTPSPSPLFSNSPFMSSNSPFQANSMSRASQPMATSMYGGRQASLSHGVLSITIGESLTASLNSTQSWLGRLTSGISFLCCNVGSSSQPMVASLRAASCMAMAVLTLTILTCVAHMTSSINSVFTEVHVRLAAVAIIVCAFYACKRVQTSGSLLTPSALSGVQRLPLHFISLVTLTTLMLFLLQTQAGTQSFGLQQHLDQHGNTVHNHNDEQFARPSASLLQSRILRVASLNTHMGISANYQVQLDGIVTALLAEDVDVLGCQEFSRGLLMAGGIDMLAWLSARLDMPYVTYNPTYDTSGGDILLSKFPFIASGRVALPSGVSQQSRRGMIWAALSIPGTTKPVTLVTTHLHHAERDHETRIAQLDAIISAVSSIPLPDSAQPPEIRRVVVFGDLNSVPGGPEAELAQSRGLVDSWPELEQAQGYTFHSRNPTQRFDWLLHSRDVTCKSISVLDLTVSDHKPVVASFEFEE
ncbi:hypothetical protein CAOG_00670 [Capsaspora owczarzaki ATCC 30864]|uniref:Endonuclease/exonuclease/phosphatase domain-containing protein n=1 Tax=Capsaspora owczarzaki (strain ATCC 30864) TaxID=595528 RepID=A0A0D2VGX4_CAPO3|nr:hypothetical protein CAOG_00670 [Capsaspora owczarzaki ATCC 30864]KJE89137.1 hypothetical protein CAOG_000670 [Capsaspora owczarzaki ATCC 30864]|eukprot:XP_004365541.2 hypothetical protein CAOG_00670 [Capsaspora owczarzaki ATCC 30864]